MDKVKFVDGLISVFWISDGVREMKGFHLIDDCFAAILDFIETSKNKDDVDLIWHEVYMNEDLDIEQGDMLVSIYKKDDDYSSWAESENDRVLSNADDKYTNAIWKALGYEVK